MEINAENTHRMGRALAFEAACLATLIRKSPVANPASARVSISDEEIETVALIMVQVLLELSEGTIDELYDALTPYVDRKFAERMRAQKKSREAVNN